MADKKKKISNSKARYKAKNPRQFKLTYNDACPGYDELCTGNAIELDTTNKRVKSWIVNNIIIKEN